MKGVGKERWREEGKRQCVGGGGGVKGEGG